MIPESTLGRLQVLNVGDGDTEFNFNPQNPSEVDRASRCVSDMLKAGYLLFVRLNDGTLRRVLSFDPNQRTYVINDPPAQESANAQDTQASATDSTPEAASPPPPTKRGRGRPRKIPASSVTTHAVARTAGG